MIKIGALNFCELDNNEQNGVEFDEKILWPFQIANIKYKLVNCLEESADIVFHSVFLKHSLTEIKGNPIKILFNWESSKRPHCNTQEWLQYTDLAISSNDDSDRNLYYPFWQLSYKNWNYYKRPISIQNKINFCSFIVRHCIPQWDGSNFRGQMFQYLSKYKFVYSFGNYENNMAFNLSTDFKEAQRTHKTIKFNLCFENNSSLPNENYITEKIINAYIYGTVPIYWGGGDKLLEYFKEDSFINCNNKSLEEILDIIEFYDTHDKEYEKMLNTYPFYQHIDYRKYAAERLITFLKNKNII